MSSSPHSTTTTTTGTRQYLHTINLACQLHSVPNTKLLVQQARKSIFILNFGELTGPHCFEQNIVLPSLKEEKSVSGWVALPDGWKVCFCEQHEAWTFECRYNSNGKYEYKCCLLQYETGLPVPSACSDWCPNASQSYRKARDGLVKDNLRPNGNLFVGLYFSNSQKMLREHFSKIFDNSDTSLLGLPGIEWLSNQTPSQRTSSLTFPSPSPKGAANVLVLQAVPVSSSPSTSHAPSKTKRPSDSLEILPGMLRQLSIEDLRNQLRSMGAADPQINEMWAKRREKAHGEEAEFYKISDSYKMSVNKEDSMTEAMAYLRGFSTDLSAVDIPPMTTSMTLAELFQAVKSNAVLLDRHQMHRAVSLLLQLPVSREITNKMFDYCDYNKDGTLTMEEFVIALEAHEKCLRDEFNSLDRDGDGIISVAELKLAQKDGDLDETNEQEIDSLLRAMAFCKQAPPDEQLKIRWPEFRSMMLLLPPATSIKDVMQMVKAMQSEVENERRLLSEFKVEA